MSKYKAIALMLMSLLLIITACGTKPAATTEQTGGGDHSSQTAQQTQSTLEKIKQAGKIVVGTSADYPPYEFHKEINKKR